MRLLKPEYKIDGACYSWIDSLLHPQKAYKNWHKRWVKLFEKALSVGYGWEYYRWTALEVEMYERLCAIKYPDTIVLSDEQIFFRDNPHGSIIVNCGKNVYFRETNHRVVRLRNTTDKNYIS